MALHGSTAPTQPKAPPRGVSMRLIVPGLAAALVGAAIATGLAGLVPGASPLLLGIVLGLAARNLGFLPGRLTAGLVVAGRVPLRIGIVLLGLQLSVRDLATLGWAIPVLAVAVVGVGLLSTVGIGRLLGIAPTRTLLIACGFSICGAAAVAGVESVLDADEEDTVSAVALVVLFGTLMIPTIPFLAEALRLPERTAALWAGASIHEVAQVVAAGGLIGGSALTLAVTVKLARVLMLAPVAAVLSVRRRPAGGPGSAARPSIVPLFVLGFVAMVALRSLAPVPHEVLSLASAVQSFLLTTAMLALGAGVRLRELARRGGRAVVLAAASTAVVGAVGLTGALVLA
ncbi:putative sulfate exporter family transporter [Sinomonas sp. ASV322]|uniref:YeiH family protein n=1 Tax=Sinomonas sp. ASV322 TaxID=3041920 RepID=UPI0027DB3381|nr:putative sulfate exporter family transporter [Sinomonas sp. ASV322]MDQ4501053.1 putative sulfate exporter family transporter [Sinomonas sp. ASV322]